MGHLLRTNGKIAVRPEWCVHRLKPPFRMMDSERIFNRKHDVILFYGKSPLAKIDMGAVAEAWTREDIIRTRKQAIYQDEHGREWIWMPGGRGHSKNKPKYLDDIIKDGKALDDVWDMPVISSSAKERLGYPTQKPEALLERIVKASSKEDDVVLDPFCGCGTSIAVAQRLGRRWIGIDITQLAITLIKHRLVTAFGDAIKSTFTVTGEPESIEDASVLAREDPYQFQLWALGLVNARPREGIKKGADKGVDGRIYFHDHREGGKTSQIILSVKGGHLKPEYVRELPSIVDREKASIGVLISLEKPTAPMRAEAASAAFYENEWWGNFPKIQLLTIEDLMGGRGILYPHADRSNRTFKPAPKAKKVAERILGLFDKDAPAE